MTQPTSVRLVTEAALANALAGIGGGGSGDVVGPSSATDNALVRFDTGTGKLVQNSTVTVSDLGEIATPLPINRTLVRDDFNRADNGSVLGSPQTGPAPILLGTGAVWGIQTNRAFSTGGPAAGYSCAVYETSQSDVVLEYTYGVYHVNEGGWFRGQGTDAQNGYAVLGTGVYKQVAGVETRVGNWFTAPLATGDRVRVIGRGPHIQIFRRVGNAGAWVHIYSHSDTQFVSNTLHGMTEYNAPSTTGRLDDLYIGGITPEIEADSRLAFTSAVATIPNDIYNVQNYGAVGDGVTDDTAAFQACIDACLGGNPAAGAGTVRQAKGRIYIPVVANGYRITAPLQIYSASGLILEGGNGETRLYADAVGMSSVLDMNGLFRCIIRNLTIMSRPSTLATTTVTTPFQLDWQSGGVALRSTANDTFENLTVRNLKCVNGFGFGVNSGAFDVSDIRVYNCKATGTWTAGETTWWQAGFHFGSGTNGNILDHNAYGIGSGAWRYGVQANAVNLSVFGYQPGYNEVDVYALGTAQVTIDSARSEHSTAFFKEAGGASYIKDVILRNIRFVGNTEFAANGRFIEKGYTGSLILENVRYSASGSAVVPMVYCSAGQTRYTSVLAVGLALPVSNPADAVQAPVVGTALVRTTLINYQEIDSSSQVVASTPFYSTTLNGTASPAQINDGITVGPANIDPDGNMSGVEDFAFDSAFKTGAATRTTDQTFTLTNGFYNQLDATSAPFTITLPSTTAAGHRFLFKKVDSTANAVTIAGGFDGIPNYILAAQHQWVEVVSTSVSGTWRVVNRDPISGNSLVFDSFTRADSASVLGTPTQQGNAWTAMSGSIWGISTNQGYQASGTASTWNGAYIDTGTPDVCIEVSLPTATSSTWPGILLRANTMADCDVMTAQGAWSRVAGTDTSLGQFVWASALSSGDRMRVLAVGANIGLYYQVGGTGQWFGQLLGATSAANMNRTRHGIVVWSTATSNRWDNFTISVPTPKQIAECAQADAYSAYYFANYRSNIRSLTNSIIGF